MIILRLKIDINFYRKNMKVRGTRLWEIIPASGYNFRGFILSLYFTHITFTLFDSRKELALKLRERYKLSCAPTVPHYEIIDTMAREIIAKGQATPSEAQRKYLGFLQQRLEELSVPHKTNC